MDFQDNRPRHSVFSKIERLIQSMQHPDNGIPVRNQKLFLTVIRSAFAGCDLIQWMNTNMDIGDYAETKNIANLLCQHGYIFPVDDRESPQLIKEDNSLYRFQSPYFWPSHNWQPDNVDYAIFLVKRTIRSKKKRHCLEEHEEVALNKLQKMLCDKWDFIYMQAEEQVRLSKERKKADKIVVDEQERAYWRVFKPVPNQAQDITEEIKRNYGPCQIALKKKRNLVSCKEEISHLLSALTHARMKVSKVIDSMTSRCSQFEEIDPFIKSQSPTNPWITDDNTLWVLNSCTSQIPTEARVKRWGFSFEELLSDIMGREELRAHLRTEYSSENICFYNAVKELKYCPNSDINEHVEHIYKEFLSQGATREINIDSKTMALTQKALKNPSRYTFDAALSHIYTLMKKDSYPRFLHSELYQNLLLASQNYCLRKK